jgi:iron complex outermembrane receptor protein
MRYHGLKLSFTALLLTALPAAAQQPEPAMSLDSLLNVTVSTAARYDQTVQQAPAAISVITAEQIERFGHLTLADALASVRGFYASYDHNYSYVGVRGFGRPTDYNNRILLLIDGQSINEPEYGSAPFGTDFPISMSMIERIEVVRGPGSVLYGTGAMFAVVNVITKTGAENSGVRVVGDAGSMNRRSAAALGMHRFTDGSMLQLSISRTELDGRDRYFAEFDTPGVSDGVARGLDAEEYNSVFLSFQRRGLSVNGRVSTRDKSVPTASWEASFNEPDTWTQDNRAAIGARLRHALSASAEAFFGLNYEHYVYKGSYRYADGLFTDDTNADWARAEAGLLWDISVRNRLVTGLELTRVFRSDYRMFYDGEMTSDMDVPFTGAALYAQMESELTRQLTAVVGVSHDRRSSNNFTTPRAALLYSPSASTTIKLMHGLAFRAPNPYELYSAAAAMGSTEAANLTSEQITTSEIALEQRFGTRGSLSASVYHNNVTDLIDYVQDDDPDANGGSYENAASATGTGFEMELWLREWRGQSAFAALTYQQAKSASTDERLTNAPTILLKAGWYKSLTNRVGAGVLMQHEGGRMTLNGDETSAFTRFDGTLTGAITPGFKLSAAVRNIFDVDYAHPGGAEHRQNILPQDGRTFVVRLDVSFK